MKFSLSELAQVTSGRLVGDDGPVSGLGIDSRVLEAGQLFAAIKGERDGHDFVGQAWTAGAAAVLVEGLDGEPSGVAIIVENVGQALDALARHCRHRLGDRVVGVTGSLGKTTTKDLLASVLGQKFVTAASHKSFNNEIGVPITLANADDSTEATVVEMGARGVGHIAHLCDLASPTTGVVTTVEAVHTEVMGDVEAIARVKGELIEALPATGLAVLNSDVAVVADLASRSAAPVLTFGTTGEVRARGVELDDDLIPSFVLVSPWGEVAVRLGVRGGHNVCNALAASAVALHFGVSLDEVALGLSQSLSSPWRMDLQHLESGAKLLNDCYNASPASVAAALRALAALDRGERGRHYAVLGVMAELGAITEMEHRNIIELAKDLNIQVLAVGTDLYGVESVDCPEDAVALIEQWNLDSGDSLLVKGSRIAGLESIAAALIP